MFKENSFWSHFLVVWTWTHCRALNICECSAGEVPAEVIGGQNSSEFSVCKSIWQLVVGWVDHLVHAVSSRKGPADCKSINSGHIWLKGCSGKNTQYIHHHVYIQVHVVRSFDALTQLLISRKDSRRCESMNCFPASPMSFAALAVLSMLQWNVHELTCVWRLTVGGEKLH